MKPDKVLCKSCTRWVKCEREEGVIMGFCLNEDLFTYTAKLRCPNYMKGMPIKEKEFDEGVGA